MECGKIIGGNPVEVTLMKVARLFTSGREVQSWASWPTSVKLWRRRDMTWCLEGHERLVCSKVSGSKPQEGQEVSASGDLQVGSAAK